MFRHNISAEVILALLCLCGGTAALGFTAIVTRVFRDNFWERLEYWSTEDLAIFSLFFLIGLITVACGFGLLKRKRWAVVIITVVLVVIMLFVLTILLLDGVSSLLTRPIELLTIILAGLGLPMCLVLLFNSVRVLPWLDQSKGDNSDVLDQVS